MQEEATIEHTGIVKSISDRHVIVNIVSHPACSGCHASGICDIAGQENKEIRALKTVSVNTGDNVCVVMERSMGFRALTLGYLLPFLLLFSILIILSVSGVPELISGISAFSSLIPYYFVLYLRKEKIGKQFTFTIKKVIK